jgi:acetyl esterase/lipase
VFLFLFFLSTQASFGELLGISHFMETIQLLMSFQEVPPTSDEHVTVMETAFDSVPVRIYIPKRKSMALRRGLFYIHGGGWCLGSAGMSQWLSTLVYPIKCDID